MLLAFNIDGSPVWDTPTLLSAPTTFTTVLNSTHVLTSPVPVDLNGDGNVELVHAASNVSSAGLPQNVTRVAIAAYDGATGSLLWEFVGPATSSTQALANPVVVDLDLDGELELIYHTAVVNADGSPAFTLPTELSLAGDVGSAFLTTAV